MRLIGTLDNAPLAEHLADVLIADGIDAKVEDGGAGWQVWVRDEDQLAAAQARMTEFLQDPDAPQFLQARQQAKQRRATAAQKQKEYRRNFVRARDAWRSPRTKLGPVVMVLLVISVVVFLNTADLPSWGDSIIGRLLMFAPPTSARVAGPTIGPQSIWSSIAHGEVWRLVTPMFLHGDWKHLIFNMYWLGFLGPRIERLQGAIALISLTLVTSLVANVAQALAVGPNFGGMSGVVYGLAGYLAAIEFMHPEGNLRLGRGILLFFVIFLVLGFTNTLEPLTGNRVANWAHLGGLVGGIAWATLLNFHRPRSH
jgi:GlpG protein